MSTWDDRYYEDEGYGYGSDPEPEPEPECACVRIDVDLDDARDCPLHGPYSELARRQKQQEAQDIWDFYNRPKS